MRDILEMGSWERSSLAASVMEVNPPPDSAYRAYEANAWSTYCRNHAQSWDGKLWGLYSHAVSGQQLHLQFRNTTFAAYIASRAPEFIQQWPEVRRADPLGVTILCITKGDRLIVSRRSPMAEQNPSGLYYVGGYMEQTDVTDGLPDVFRAAQRELSEETGLGLADTLTVAGLAYDPTYCHPELFVVARLAQTGEEVEQRWSLAVDRGESENLLAVPLGQVVSGSGLDELGVPTWSFQIGQALLRAQVR